MKEKIVFALEMGAVGLSVLSVGIAVVANYKAKTASNKSIEAFTAARHSQDALDNVVSAIVKKNFW